MSKHRSAYREFPNVSKFLEENLRHRRTEMKISKTILAAKAGVTRNCIQQIECHEHLPLPSTLFKVIGALDFSEDEAGRFWVGLDEAYAKDRALQEASNKTLEVVS